MFYDENKTYFPKDNREIYFSFIELMFHKIWARLIEPWSKMRLGENCLFIDVDKFSERFNELTGRHVKLLMSCCNNRL